MKYDIIIEPPTDGSDKDVEILINTLSIIDEKKQFNCEQVKWVIYDYHYLEQKIQSSYKSEPQRNQIVIRNPIVDLLEMFHIENDKNVVRSKYGYTYFKRNIVFVEINVIRGCYITLSNVSGFSNRKTPEDLLDLLLHEITHIIIQSADHSSEEFLNKYMELKNMFRGYC